MSEEPRTERTPRAPGNGAGMGVPLQTVVALVIGLAGGGGGSLLGTRGVAESLARMETQLDAISDEMRRDKAAAAAEMAGVRAELRELRASQHATELRLERLAPGGTPR